MKTLEERKFNPEMLVIARKSRGLTQEELAKRLSMKQSHISKIEAGMLNPSEKMLEILPRILKYQEDFFYRNDRNFGISAAIVYHRMRQNISRKLLDKIEAQVNIYRMHISTLLRSVEINECKFHPLDVDEYGGPVNIANTIRAFWKLPSGPIKNLVWAVENAGGIVIPYDFGTSRLDGLSQWIPNLPPLFFINANIPGDRFRLSLAHELGHVLMHTIPKPNMEEEAFEFAAELLMPMREIGPSLKTITIAKLADLKMYWKVSMAALIYRAEKLKSVPARHILYLRKKMSAYRMQEPIDIPREQPTILSKIIEIYLKELGYTVSELCKILSMYENEFMTLYRYNNGRRRLTLAN